MKISNLLFLSLLTIFVFSCDVNDNNSDIDDDNDIEVPATYEFSRNGESTVSFSGQTTRIKMADELFSAMSDFDNTTEELLLQMYRNQAEDGSDVAPFSEADLNSSDKSIKSKVAASRDYFSTNATLAAEIKNDLESWLSGQVNEVFPNRNQLAEPGVAGQIADGSGERYINGQGLEYNQMIAKSLNGALMADQMLNNYLSPSVLDEGSNRENNDNGVTDGDSNYTSMEHKWDEAYGYIFGTSANPANPIATIGSDDIFLNKYTGQVSEDEDFASLAEDIFEAFKLGRAAIVAGDYDVRDEQAAIIREAISTVIGVRGVYYLQAGKRQIEAEEFGSAFHSLSEGFGFIYSLQFTRVPGTNQPYMTHSEVESMLK
ncbi:MAG: DUF4856 domain-containing protein [Balneolaceae bacterium]|nr:DUF4856 domain-containing protein [Balneolaceae bacterium]